MKDAQKPDHVSFDTLIGWLKQGRFVVPDFQREFEWNPWDIKDLMRSIMLDYYIGSLLIWKGKKENFEALSCENIFGFDGKSDPQHIILDGQQRLTAIYYACATSNVKLPGKSKPAIYYIRVDRFMLEDYEEAFKYDWLSKRLIKLLNDPAAQYEEHFFPFSVIGAGGWELPNWVQGYEQYWKIKAKDAEDAGDSSNAAFASMHAKNAKEFGEHLKGITQQYQISYRQCT